MSDYPIVQPFNPVTRNRLAWAAFLDRLAFVCLCALALTFAFELAIGSTLADATVTNVKLLLIVVIGCWILSRAASGVWPRFPRSLALPVILWLATLLISTLLAPDYLTHTIRFMSRILQGLLLAWAVYDLVDTASRWQMVVRVLVVAGLVVAGLGLAEAANIAPVVRFLSLFHASQTHVGDLLRVSSSLEYATIASMVLEMLIPLMLAWAITTTQGWLRLTLMIGVMMSVTALVLTLTRSAVLGLAAALVMMAGISFWYRQRRIAIIAVAALIATAVVIGLLVIVNRTVGLRLLTESENGWYLARYAAPPSLSARPNELLNVPVQVTNTGLRPWQAAADPPFRLGYTLIREDQKTKGLDGIRADLPADVLPGQTLALTVHIPAPTSPGQYLIQWDMVEETVLWFSWRGSPLGSTRLTVAGTPVTNGQRLQLPPANHSTASPPVERPALWGAALRMVREHPLFGVGPDDFRWIYGRYLALGSSDTNIHANSIYFEVLADTGVLGLLAFLWLNWRLLRLAWQELRVQSAQSGHPLWIWHLALLACLIAWFVHGFFDYFYEFAGTYVLFWLAAGLAANRVMAQLPRERALQEA